MPGSSVVKYSAFGTSVRGKDKGLKVKGLQG